MMGNFTFSLCNVVKQGTKISIIFYRQGSNCRDYDYYDNHRINKQKIVNFITTIINRKVFSTSEFQRCKEPSLRFWTKEPDSIKKNVIYIRNRTVGDTICKSNKFKLFQGGVFLILYKH